MRLAGSGYGGGQGVSPYNIHASLLADASSGLATKRYKDEFGLQKERFGLEQKRFDELLKESEFRNSMLLAEKGFGTQQQLNTLGSQYGLSYGTGGGSLGMGGVSTGLASSRPPVDYANVLSQYQGTLPYANQMYSGGGGLNPSYDPGMSNYNKQLARILAQYRG